MDVDDVPANMYIGSSTPCSSAIRLTRNSSLIKASLLTTVLPARLAPCNPQIKKSSFQMRSRTCNCFGVYKSLIAISHLVFQHRDEVSNLIVLLFVTAYLRL